MTETRLPWSTGDDIGGPYLVHGSHYYQLRYDGAGWSVFYSDGVDELIEPHQVAHSLGLTAAKRWAELDLRKRGGR